MCDPVSLALITATIGIGSAVSSYTGQQQAYVDNVASANLNYAQRKEALSAEAAQGDAARTEDAVDREIESARASGHIAASISEQGLGNQTATQLVNTQAFESGRATSISELNFQNEREQLARSATGAAIERNSQIASVSKPSSLDLILGIGKAGMQGFSTYSAVGGKVGSSGSSSSRSTSSQRSNSSHSARRNG